MNIYSEENKQVKKPYFSTIEFDKFIHSKIKKSKTILDAGSGQGGTLFYYVNKYRNIQFTGMDYREQNIQISKKLFKKNLLKNCNFIKFDLLKKNKRKIKEIDGIICQKTFCTFKNIEIPMTNLIKLNPDWIAINSLFWEGEMDVLIHIRDRKESLSGDKTIIPGADGDPDGDFNIHSVNNLERHLSKKNYKISKIKKFFPSKKIKTDDKNYRGTYTMETSINKNTMFSGPVFLPWYFILIEKNSNFKN